MKAIVELPAIAEAMAQGDLSFSAGRELTRVATAETEHEWLEAAIDKNLRQIESLVSGHERGDKPTDPPDPKLRRRTVRYDDVQGETVALLRQARQILERELGERIDNDAFLRALGRLVVDGARQEERTHAPYQIAISVCATCKRATQDGAGIVVEMSPATLETALCDAEHIGIVEDLARTGLPRARPDTSLPRTPHGGGLPRATSDSGSRRGSSGSVSSRATSDTSAPRGNSGSAPPRATSGPDAASPTGRNASAHATFVRKSSRAKSDIPPALRRKVNARDHGRCQVPWCRSSRNIDQHHMLPVSEGGQHTLDNLITLCESHHIAHHEGALDIAGTAASPIFTRRAQSSFTNAERAIETRLALTALGFAKQEVMTALEKTRAHVGSSALSLEQWIKIALSYCPKPRG